MKQIIALQQYTDKFISLYEGEVRNIQDSLADKLIEKGVAAEHDKDEKISSLEDLLLTISITETPGMTTTYTCNLTYDEIKDYFINKFNSFTKEIAAYPVLIEHKIAPVPNQVAKYLGSIYVINNNSIYIKYYKIRGSGDNIVIDMVQFKITEDNVVTRELVHKQF